MKDFPQKSFLVLVLKMVLDEMKQEVNEKEAR